MLKKNKKADIPWKIVTMALAVIFLVLLFIGFPPLIKDLYAKAKGKIEIGLDGKKSAIGSSGSPIDAVAKAFETCKPTSIGNDCLCDSKLELNFPSGEMEIKKIPSGIELNHDGNTKKIEGIEYCLISSIVRPPEFKFSDAIRSEFSSSVKLSKAKDTGKIIIYTSAGTRTSLETSPIKLFRHEENGIIYLCLARSGISYKACTQ